MKPLFDKKKLKGKGLQKQPTKKSKVPKELKKTAVTVEKPAIEFSWGDRLNQFGMWFQGFVVDASGEILKRIIPGWVWIALIVVVGIVLYIAL